MNLFGFFQKKSSAPVARERLQMLLHHERVAGSQSRLLMVLQEEILAVIAKHMPIDRDKVVVKMDNSSETSTLEIDIEMPTGRA